MVEQVIEKKELGEAMGRIPSGVFIVTAELNGNKLGMIASWIQQVGFEPLMLSVAMHPEREIYQAIEKTGRFTINVLSNQNMNLMKNFSRYSPEQFEGIAHQSSSCGVILSDVVAYIDCQLKEKARLSDHHLLIAEAVEGRLLNSELEPMVHLRKSGFNY